MEGTAYEGNLGNEPLGKKIAKFPSVEDARKAETNHEGMLSFPTMNPTGQL